MFRPRVIPVLLLKGQGLVKSVKFKDHRYVGDPLNATRLFNEFRADELVFLDIDASRAAQTISTEFVESVAEIVTIPFSVGGGIRSLNDIASIVRAGVEKVVIGTQAAIDPDFVKQAAKEFGSSTISVCIDFKLRMLGKSVVTTHCGTKNSKWGVLEFAKAMESNGAGEIILQSIDRDGTMSGYDIDQIGTVSKSLSIPVVALGGAENIDDFRRVVDEGKASACAAGSLFVYHGKLRGVLINYPETPVFANNQ